MTTSQVDNLSNAQTEREPTDPTEASAAYGGERQLATNRFSLRSFSQQLQHRRQQLSRRLHLLSIAQRAYVIALLLLILTSMEVLSSDLGITLAAMVGISAFMLDAWPAFEKFWHKLYGKALLIALYAVILNIVLAYAEATVNNMTGVKPDLMRYTVNLVAMLLAPAWLFGATVVVMLGYMILHMLKIMLYLVLRPLGIRSRQLLDDEAYPKTFLTIRLLLMPFVCVMMVQLVDAYIKGHSDVTWQTNDSNLMFDLEVAPGELPALIAATPGAAMTNHVAPKASAAPAPSAADGATQVIRPTIDGATSSAKPSMDSGATLNQTALNQTALSQTAPSHTAAEQSVMNGSAYLSQRIAQAEQHGFHWYEVLAAQFLYHIESQGKSSCRLTADEHAIPVGDWDVLIITPKPEAPLGFAFAVRPCQSPGQQWLFQQLTPVNPNS
jgi:hypothetical protein